MDSNAPTLTNEPPAATAAASPSPDGKGPTTIEASMDPALLRERLAKYQTVAKKMREALQEKEALLKEKQGELNALKPFVEQMKSSVLTASSGGGGVPAFDIAARVQCSSDGVGWSWACISGKDGEGNMKQEWHTEDALLSRHPGLVLSLRAVAPYLSPLDAEQLRSRLVEVQEELRKYRVRAEALLRQKDAELAAARERALQAQTDRITRSDSSQRGSAFFASGSLRRGYNDLYGDDAADNNGSFSDGTPEGRASGGGSGARSLFGLPSGKAPSAAGNDDDGDDDAYDISSAADREGDGNGRRTPSLFSSGRLPSAFQQSQRSGFGDSVGGQQAAQLQAQVERLLRWRADAQEREASLRDACAEAQRENAGLRDELAALTLQMGTGNGSAVSATSVPSSSASAFQQPSLDAHTSGSGGLAAQLRSLQAEHGKVTSDHAKLTSEHSVLSLQHDKLSGEYTAYRRRAMGLMKEKDEQLQKALEEVTSLRSKLASASASAAHAATASGTSPSGYGHAGHDAISAHATPRGGGRSSRGTPSSSLSTSSTSSSSPPPDGPRWEYLRNVLKQYLSASDPSVRASLEPAVMMVMGLSQLEMQGIHKSRGGGGASGGGGAATGSASAAGGGGGAADLIAAPLSSLFSTASSFLGGWGSGGGATAASSSIPSSSPQSSPQPLTAAAPLSSDSSTQAPLFSTPHRLHIRART